MGTAHNTWLLRVIIGLQPSRKRSEHNKNSAGRELGDLSNAATEDGV